MRRALILLLLAVACAANPLDDYVKRDDGVFSIVDTGKHFTFFGMEYFFYNLTSVKWLTPNDTDRSIWTHTVIFMVPPKLNRDCTTAFMWYTWGENEDPNRRPETWQWDDPQNLLDFFLAGNVAKATRCLAVAVYNIPNQYVFFNTLGHTLHEDSEIAYTFMWATQNGSFPERNLYFPMTKAAIKAMDAVQLVAPKAFGMQIKDFILSGASKRGWTSWLAAAVDPQRRVSGIVPLVFDGLNITDFLMRHYRSYGGWSFALEFLAKFDVVTHLQDPKLVAAVSLIDPWTYRDRLTMPKLSISSCGDEFLLLDNARHFSHEMLGEMHHLIVLDADHVLAENLDLVLKGMIPFSQAVINSVPRPKIDWNIDDTTGQITAVTSVPPKKSVLRFLELPNSALRDFRYLVKNVTPCIKAGPACLRFMLWSHRDPVTINSTAFATNVSVPSSGWTGFYLEFTFANGPGLEDFVLTTPANVLPLGYPFPPCTGEGCRGHLV